MNLTARVRESVCVLKRDREVQCVCTGLRAMGHTRPDLPLELMELPSAHFSPHMGTAGADPPPRAVEVPPPPLRLPGLLHTSGADQGWAGSAVSTPHPTTSLTHSSNTPVQRERAAPSLLQQRADHRREYGWFSYLSL